jgi:hypothetical protein
MFSKRYIKFSLFFLLKTSIPEKLKKKKLNERKPYKQQRIKLNWGEQLLWKDKILLQCIRGNQMPMHMHF